MPRLLLGPIPVNHPILSSKAGTWPSLPIIYLHPKGVSKHLFNVNVSSMSATTNSSELDDDVKTLHRAIPLTLSPHTSICALIHPLPTPLVFLTTTDPGSSPPAALGSFVYALPNRIQPAEPLCTVLYGSAVGVDFSCRVAKVLTKKLNRPIYVGWSGQLGGVGSQIEEEMEGLRAVVETVTKALVQRGGENEVVVNGMG